MLFAGTGRETYLRALARDCGVAVGSIQPEVAHLSEAGFLTKRRDGNRLYYRANTQHPLFPELQGMVHKTSGLKDVLAEALSPLKGIETAFVFGSLAAGREKAGSDIDLMILGSVGLRAIAPKLRPASEKLDREINPHIMSVKAWKSRRDNGDAFVSDVARKPKLFILGGPSELE